MNSPNDGGKTFDSREMEEWLDSFFLDPLTTYLDDTIFRIDLYDSENAFIVEALLPNVKREQIEIVISDHLLQIKVKENLEKGVKIKKREICFPMSLTDLKMETSFCQEILEIKICKNHFPNIDES